MGMHRFSMLDAVGSHLHVADRSICDQDKNLVITKTRSLCSEVLCEPERCFVVNYHPDTLLRSKFSRGHSTSM